MDNYVYAYYQRIQNGSEVVGKWIRMLYERIVQGIESGGYIFDQRKANNVIRFFEKFVRHNKGKLAPATITLSLWQKAMLSVIFGIVDQNGARVFREVFVVVGRKCGKTLLASGVITYEAYVDGEFGSEIYCVAPKLDQSDLVYSAFDFTKDHTPAFAQMTKKRKNDLYIQKTNTSIKKIAFNEKKADGYNPQLTVGDEMSSWPAARGLKQYEVMVSGTGAREQPLTLSISSAGYVNDGIYDELFKRGTKFLLGNSRETHLLPFIYMIDDPDKWDDINELRKSLPGLGVSVSVDFVLSEIRTAYESPSKKAEFLTKYCNVKQNAVQAWLKAKYVTGAISAPLSLEQFRSSYAVLGIDLSQTTDLTAAALLVEKGGKIYTIVQFWMPAAMVEEAEQRDGIPYRQYISRGILRMSGEHFVDYHDVFAWAVELVEKYEILPLWTGYDRYSSQYLIKDMEAYGFHCDDVFQGYNMHPAIQQLEGLLGDGVIDIGDNDLLKMHLLDTALKSEGESRRSKIVKIDQRCHIDGTAAILCALIVREKYYDTIGEQLNNAG
jgi:phage terminase large subunit-like protein